MREHSRAALLLMLTASACSLGQGGGAGPDAASNDDAPARDASSFADAPFGDASSPMDATLAPDAAPDAGILATCLGILGNQPAASDGTYLVDPGSGAIPVLCDMLGGGWTLVGREKIGGTGQFRFLDTDSSNAPALASGASSGLLGKRFVGKYTSVRVAWGASTIVFTKPVSFDLFANTVNLAAPLTAFSTTEGALNGWVTSAGGAVLCVAAHDNDVRPGDTSWGITAKDDANRGCGCSSSFWAGRGAYYGGTIAGQQTVCNGQGGGWAAVKDDTIPKGGIVPTYETRIWIK